MKDPIIFIGGCLELICGVGALMCALEGFRTSNGVIAFIALIGGIVLTIMALQYGFLGWYGI